jgi:hypothetical protein
MLLSEKTDYAGRRYREAAERRHTVDAAGRGNTVDASECRNRCCWVYVETEAANCRERCCWVRRQIMLGAETDAAGC